MAWAAKPSWITNNKIPRRGIFSPIFLLSCHLMMQRSCKTIENKSPQPPRLLSRKLFRLSSQEWLRLQSIGSWKLFLWRAIAGLFGGFRACKTHFSLGFCVAPTPRRMISLGFCVAPTPRRMIDLRSGPLDWSWLRARAIRISSDARRRHTGDRRYFRSRLSGRRGRRRGHRLDGRRRNSHWIDRRCRNGHRLDRRCRNQRRRRLSEPAAAAPWAIARRWPPRHRRPARCSSRQATQR